MHVFWGLGLAALRPRVGTEIWHVMQYLQYLCIVKIDFIQKEQSVCSVSFDLVLLYFLFVEM